MAIDTADDKNNCTLTVHQNVRATAPTLGEDIPVLIA